eukprot:15443383-Alexandrium_andersonii.AAC.1
MGHALKRVGEFTSGYHTHRVCVSSSSLPSIGNEPFSCFSNFAAACAFLLSSATSGLLRDVFVGV